MTLRARVKNGRLLLDEPTELPDGAEVELVPVDDLDELDAGRARLEEFLGKSIATHVPGSGVAAADVLERVRSR